MEFDTDHARFAMFVGGFVFFFAVETLFARRRLTTPRVTRLAFHVGVATVNTVIIRTLTYVPLLLWSVHVEAQGWGLSRMLGLAGWTELLASLVVLDFFIYLWHRANHRVRFLWRFHKAHHSDPEMDVTTALRFHPGELLISALVKAGWILIWGPTATAWFLFEVSISLAAQFHHTNIDFPDRIERPLRWLVVTPRLHAAHHAVDRAFGNHNFATVFSIWDRLFGSWATPADGGLTTALPGSIGLPEGRSVGFSPLEWLIEPARRRNLALAGESEDT